MHDRAHKEGCVYPQPLVFTLLGHQRDFFSHLLELLLCSSIYTYHSSEIRGLSSTKCSSEMLQNLLYFMYKKTHVVFFIFHFLQLYFLPYECPGQCRHRPGHS